MFIYMNVFFFAKSFEILKRTIYLTENHFYFLFSQTGPSAAEGGKGNCLRAYKESGANTNYMVGRRRKTDSVYLINSQTRKTKMQRHTAKQKDARSKVIDCFCT